MDVNEVINVISDNQIREDYKTIIRVRVPADADPSSDKELYDSYISEADVEFIVLSPYHHSICIHAKRS